MYSKFPVWEKSYMFTHTYMIDTPKKAEWIYNKILTRLALNKKNVHVPCQFCCEDKIALKNCL